MSTFAYYNEIDPMFIAYLAICSVSGKSYVGITSKSVSVRWQRHVDDARTNNRSFALHRAIRKYGADSFAVSEIACCSSWEDLCATEKQLIAQLQTRAPRGYNMTEGGDGVIGLSEESLASLKAKCRALRHTADAKQRIGAAAVGRTKSAEVKQRIGDAHRGKKLGAAHRAKLSAAKTGKKMPPRTDEHKNRISEGLRLSWLRRRGEAN